MDRRDAIVVGFSKIANENAESRARGNDLISEIALDRENVQRQMKAQFSFGKRGQWPREPVSTEFRFLHDRKERHAESRDANRQSQHIV